MTIENDPLDDTLPVGTVVTHTMTISNDGDGDLDWMLFEDASTLAMAPFVASAPSGSNSVPLVIDSVPADAGSSTLDPLSPSATVTMTLDDGTNENNIGIGGGTELIWLNYFSLDASNFPFVLDEMRVYFPGADGVAIGDNVELVVYSDDDGDPSNGATWLASYPTTIQVLDDWNVYPLAVPVDFSTPTHIFLGVLGMEVPGSSYFPAALDATVSQGRSWLGWWTSSPPPTPPTLPPDDTWILIDSFIPGNWLIRGYGETYEVACDAPDDIPWVSVNPISGTVTSGSADLVDVTFDSTSMSTGTYTGTLCL
ncbi:MAG: hypothetical protein GY792_33615, partial [Gammaproteobacteria bacterium]|nr:hypothetical protein [Gammaproteobacteria bacterium]